jgi:hypothetical protein
MLLNFLFVFDVIVKHVLSGKRYLPCLIFAGKARRLSQRPLWFST